MRHIGKILSGRCCRPPCAAGASICLGEDLEAPLPRMEGKSPGGMTRRFLLRQANQAIERWKADYEKLKTPEQIAAYQRRARETFLNSIGGLPERTPLKPQVVGAVLRPGYRVEKIIFQSQPNHYATALLYLPDAPQFRPPHPAVLVLCGHGFLAKGSPTYQAVCAMLALHGMAALILDPIDQGERGQYLGRGGWPRVWGVPGHTSIGMGCILLGRNTARFEIWDGMRAIDYLQLREEIDLSSHRLHGLQRRRNPNLLLGGVGRSNPHAPRRVATSPARPD